AWIRAIQNQGMPVMSWYPMCYSAEAVRVHPEWASRPFPGDDRPKYDEEAAAHCCINTPYGEALIAFAIEAIGELGLDGFWFDGSHFSPANQVRCACDFCSRKFKSETGFEFPPKKDWEDASFRHWVKWRYRTFTEYWGRLAGEVRRAHPHARVAINHLHRPDGGTSCWPMGAPLGPTGADAIGGTEGSSLWRTSAFITRLTRAYGYDEVENWMGFHLLHTALKGDPTVYLHHALDCMTAGGMPSFGTDDSAARNRRTYEALAAIINPRAPWVGGESVPYVALHVSDQAETFHFARLSRQRDHTHFPHGYWRSLLGWDHLLTETQCLTDVIFDAHLKSGSLSRYPVVIMPLSMALSDADLAALEDYVAGGGVLVAGPGFGACDEWGEPADPLRVRRLLGIHAVPPPETDHQTTPPDGMAIHHLGCGKVIRLQGDVGGRFHASRSRILARATADLLRKLAPPVIRVTDNPNIHVGLFRRKGELILHVQNGIGYSETLKAVSSPLLRPPSLRRGVRLEIDAFPVRKVELVVGESGKRPAIHTGNNGTTIILPELGWGAVLRLET
ncbi:MAG: alpha-amylase family protein, partial [Victivallales bacterium]